MNRISLLSNNEEISGAEYSKTNKIRDIEVFACNSNKYSIIIDHRNHRLQIFEIIENKLEFVQVIYKFNNIPLILPGNIHLFRKESDRKYIFVLTEVKGLERIILFSLIFVDKNKQFEVEYLDTYYYLNQSDQSNKSHGPGGPSSYGDFVLIPQYMIKKLLILKINGYKFTEIYQYDPSYDDISLMGPIDTCITNDGQLIIVDSQGLGGTNKENNKLVIFTINFAENGLICVKPIREFQDKFNFTHSAGAISFNNELDIMCISDTGNNKLKFYDNKFDKILEYENTNEFIFPLSTIFIDNKLILASYHPYGKSEIMGYDKLLIYEIKYEYITKIKDKKNQLLIKCNTKKIYKPMENNPYIITNQYIDKNVFTKVSESKNVKMLMKETFLKSPIHIAHRIDPLELKQILDNLVVEKKVTKNEDSFLYIDTYIDNLLTQIDASNPIMSIKALISKEKDAKKELFRKDLVIYQYEQILQTSMDEWNLATLASRGLIFYYDSTKEQWIIKGTPFPKFWNTGEGWGVRSLDYEKDRSGVTVKELNNIMKDIGGKFILEEKVDGSLGIIININGKWIVTTKGSFTSPMAIEATLWIRYFNMTSPLELDPESTYLCEIISPENNVVIKYNHNMIVLLGGYDKKGYEIPYYIINRIVINSIPNEKIKTIISENVNDVNEMNKQIEKVNRVSSDNKVILRRPVQSLSLDVNFQEIAEIIRQWNNSEGVIAMWKFNNGTTYRMKIKADSFIDMQKTSKKYNKQEAINKFKDSEIVLNLWIANADEEYYEYLVKLKLQLEYLFDKTINNIIQKIRKNISDIPKNISDFIKHTSISELSDEEIYSLFKTKFRKSIIDLMQFDDLYSSEEILIKANVDENTDLPVFLYSIYKFIKKTYNVEYKKCINILIRYMMHFYNYKIVADIKNSILIIKYLESSKTWTRWSRKARGTVMYVLPFGNGSAKFIVLQQLLDRGAEVLTPMHTKHNVMTTQDIIPGSEIESTPIDYLIEKFTIDQRKTIKILLNKDEKIDGYLSMKVDGSLCAINVYKQSTVGYTIICRLINNMEDSPLKKIYQRYIGKKFLVIISSQGYIIMDYNSDKFTWDLGAIIFGFLNVEIPIGYLPVGMEEKETLINNYFDIFYDKIITFAKKLIERKQWNDGSISISFESVCKNREDIMGNIKNILAISYGRFMFRLLGVTVNIEDTTGLYIPHCNDIIQEIISEIRIPNCSIDWEDPLFWKFTNNAPVTRITEMLQDLENIIHVTKLTDLDFLRKYPPSNIRIKNPFSYQPKYNIIRSDMETIKEYLISNQEIKILKKYGIKQEELDFEGFIFYRNLDNYKYFDYSKIKHPYYNQLHKINLKNKNKLLLIPYQVGKIYPNLEKLHKMHSMFTTILCKIRQHISDNIFNGIEISEIYKQRNNISSVHSNIENIFIKEFEQIGIIFKLNVENEDLRKQGFISLIYHFKKYIFEFNESKPEWIPNNFADILHNGTCDTVFISNTQKKLFYWISMQLVKSNYKEFIVKLFDPFFKSVESSIKPLLPKNVIKSDTMFRIMVFNILSTFQFTESKKTYGYKKIDITQEHIKARIHNIIHNIITCTADIILLQEIDNEFEKYLYIFNENNLSFTYDGKKMIQYKKRFFEYSWQDQKDAIGILYSKKFNPIYFSSGNFIDETPESGNGSAYIFTIFKDINTNINVFVINIHIKIDNWEDPNYDIAQKILPHVRKYIFEKAIKGAIDNGIVFASNDVIIFGGDFNAYQFKFMNPINEIENINDFAHFWNIKYSVNKRNWLEFKEHINFIYKTLSHSLIENDMGYISSVNCSSGSGGETDHILSSVDTIGQYYHMDTKHLYDVLNIGCSDAYDLYDSDLPCSNKKVKYILQCVQEKYNRIINTKNLKELKIVSDHYPKVVDLYYQELKVNLVQEHTETYFKSVEQATIEEYGSIFMIYTMYTPTPNSKYLMQYLREKLEINTGLDTILINMNDTKNKGFEKLWKYNEKKNLICILETPLDYLTYVVKDDNTKNRLAFSKAEKSVFPVGKNEKNKMTSKTFNEILDKKVNNYNIKHIVVTFPDSFITKSVNSPNPIIVIIDFILSFNDIDIGDTKLFKNDSVAILKNILIYLINISDKTIESQRNNATNTIVYIKRSSYFEIKYKDTDIDEIQKKFTRILENYPYVKTIISNFILSIDKYLKPSTIKLFQKKQVDMLSLFPDYELVIKEIMIHYDDFKLFVNEVKELVETKHFYDLLEIKAIENEIMNIKNGAIGGAIGGYFLKKYMKYKNKYLSLIKIK
jgi:hypothetical protein